WEKKGLTYRLVQPTPPPIEAEITARVEAIGRLGDRLLGYARRHGGAFPTPDEVDELPGPLRRVPPPPGGSYVYVGGRLPGDDSPSRPLPLAYEPESVGPDRLVLMTDGRVQWMPATEVERVLSSREP
ncbi:MAG: hypothetical protein QOE66_382, partial [Chloroflexota bacterium]|nr:hypothetical protein [Chloroflexota bacterium]